ncbi:sulfatase-like hydrolase/transferase [Pantoea phytobeneficialis]|uniref:Sulfatase-like hydrolase/transferase n=1 Tax=Pantoea phytobeneficialis TaxID=2052056 RepID=A0AAP9HA35_9GAMM|nr:sulfatase-like hydrolase/transferase [Pantoea phytobeneficialis]MDO6407427.1 sulfatase-like hydrolase/transferase [Pantoea phytobeneficialis]QGR09525.1 hypothetical protein CTZ24_23950 [Pantoea phytobeneficialis]
MKKIQVFWGGLLALCPALFVLNQKSGTVIKVYLTTVLLFLISAWFFKRKSTVLLSLALCFVLSLSVVTSLYFHFEFDTAFSTMMATTFINTSQKESIDMLYYNYRYVFWFAIIFLLYVSLSYYLSRRVTERKLVLSGIILLLYTGISIFLYTVSGKTRSEDFLISERLLVNSPLYNFSPIVRAYNDAKLTDIVMQAKNTYDYSWQDKGIDNYVIVIGESARRKDHGIYGSDYPTTPFIGAQHGSMLLFNQAIAPAPLTILSVPASLAKVHHADDVPLTAWADNVISLTNDLKLDTYWFSNQGGVGQSNSLITAMAKRAGHHKWNETIGFDSSLVNELAQVIPEPEEKLIVLHFYGSHGPVCERFPRSETIPFTVDVYDNCYLNAIAYTDKQLGRLFSLLAGTRPSLIYFLITGWYATRKNTRIITIMISAIRPNNLLISRCLSGTAAQSMPLIPVGRCFQINIQPVITIGCSVTGWVSHITRSVVAVCHSVIVIRHHRLSRSWTAIKGDLIMMGYRLKGGDL